MKNTTKRIQLEQDIKNLQNDGLSMEEIARLKVEERNQGRMETYIKSNNLDGLNAMKERNILEYGRAEGTHLNNFIKSMVHGKM